MAGYSLKAWWLSISAPIVGYLYASITGFLLAGAVVGGVAHCRRRWVSGARGSDLLRLH